MLGDIGEMLNKEHKEEKAVNRRMFYTILQNIRFLARQGLPFRSHQDIDSNFIQLLLLRSLDRPDIMPWMKKKTNKYTCHDVQDECLKILSLQIIREVSRNFRESACFTIRLMSVRILQIRSSSLFVSGGWAVIFKIMKILLVHMKWEALMLTLLSMPSEILYFVWDLASLGVEASATTELQICAVVRVVYQHRFYLRKSVRCTHTVTDIV